MHGVFTKEGIYYNERPNNALHFFLEENGIVVEVFEYYVEVYSRDNYEGTKSFNSSDSAKLKNDYLAVLPEVRETKWKEFLLEVIGHYNYDLDNKKV